MTCKKITCQLIPFNSHRIINLYSNILCQSAKKAVQIKNQQRLLNELKQEREQREQKEKQRQQQLELELKSKRQHAEETVSPYFKVPSVPTFLPNMSSVTLEKQPMNQIRNNLQGPQQQQVIAKPAEKSMGLNLPTFDFGRIYEDLILG